MKIVGNILIWVSIALGVLGTASSYHVSIHSSYDELVGMELGADAGVKIDKDGKPKPLVPARKTDQKTPAADANHDADQDARNVVKEDAKTDVHEDGEKDAKPGPPTRLTEEIIERLRKNDVELGDRNIVVHNVRVKQFNARRWQGWWLFLLAVVGMIAGAVLVRSGSHREAARNKTGDAAQTILASLRRAAEEVARLREQLLASADHLGELPRTADRLKLVQDDLADNVVDRLDSLRAQVPLGTLAEIVERFATAERQINRARSTATDLDPVEVVECLQSAAERLAETIERIESAPHA